MLSILSQIVFNYHFFNEKLPEVRLNFGCLLFLIVSACTSMDYNPSKVDEVEDLLELLLEVQKVAHSIHTPMF